MATEQSSDVLQQVLSHIIGIIDLFDYSFRPHVVIIGGSGLSGLDTAFEGRKVEILYKYGQCLGHSIKTYCI